MSDQIVSIIPSSPYIKIPYSELLRCREHIQEHVKCDSVDIKMSEHPIFVDCGSNLQKITCPICGNMVSFDWWGKAMDKAYECSFRYLDVVLPCCRKTASLNDLIYDFNVDLQCVRSIYLIHWNLLIFK